MTFLELMMQNPFNKGYLESEELRNLGFKKIGNNVLISTQCTIVGLENISIGDNCRIDDYCSLLAAGGKINLGKNIHIGSYSYINGGSEVNINDFANLSQGVRIYSKSDNYDGSTLTNPTISEALTRPIKKAVCIERHCILGSGAIVLPGSILNEGAAVGALSLVTGELNSWSIYAGIPAKFIKARLKNLLADEHAINK